MSTVQAYVHRAEVQLGGGDSGAPGAAVTTRLCGGWQHEGACRWPHHTSVEGTAPLLVLRVVFVAEPGEEQGVRRLVVEGLASGTSAGPGGESHWELLEEGPADLREDERGLGDRLSGV